MKFAVILENAGGELAREIGEVPAGHEDPDAYVDDIVSGVIEEWILNVGDTIRIVEVRP